MLATIHAFGLSFKVKSRSLFTIRMRTCFMLHINHIGLFMLATIYAFGLSFKVKNRSLFTIRMGTCFVFHINHIRLFMLATIYAFGLSFKVKMRLLFAAWLGTIFRHLFNILFNILFINLYINLLEYILSNFYIYFFDCLHLSISKQPRHNILNWLCMHICPPLHISHITILTPCGQNAE